MSLLIILGGVGSSWSWIAPVTDWASSDYFNVADWERIDGNAHAIKTMLDAADYLDIPLNTLTPPTITTIPMVNDINEFVENIESLRLAACIPMTLGLVVLPYAYIGGANEVAPDYENVNDWENNLDIMYAAIPKAIDYRIYCGVADCGQTRLWQNRFR